MPKEDTEKESEISGEEEDEGEKADGKQLNFANAIKKYPVLFNKSQLPSVKSKKEKAIGKVLSDLLTNSGQKFNAKSLMKKISRMKTDVKKKTDCKKTGNKKANLKEWEKVIFEIIGAEGNPSIGKVEGAAKVGDGKPVGVGKATGDGKDTEDGKDTGDGNAAVIESSPCTSTNTTTIAIPPRPGQKKRNSEVLREGETEESKHLTTTELQRAVLIEQLLYLREKRKKLNDY